jgi:multidrug efflux pump
MNIIAPFVHRPVATTLLSIGVALAGAVSFFLLPVSPLPQVDFPTVSVSASLPGASPEVWRPRSPPRSSARWGESPG